MPSNPSDEVVQRIKNLTLSPEIHTRLEEIRKSLLETYYKLLNPSTLFEKLRLVSYNKEPFYNYC